MDELSSYQWKNELKTAVDNIRHEVALYKEGNFDVVDEMPKATATQMTIGQTEEDIDFAEAAK